MPLRHRTFGVRPAIAATLISSAFALGACEDSGSKDPQPVSGVLQPADLPARPTASAQATVPPQLSRYCSFNYGMIFAPGFDITGVEYKGINGATLVTTVNRLKGAVLTDERITAIREEFERCPASTAVGTDGEYIRQVTLSEGRFGYKSFSNDKRPEGEMGFAWQMAIAPWSVWPSISRTGRTQDSIWMIC